MPDILSQDEIDALLTATGSDEGGGGGEQVVSSGAKSDSRPIITYDFRHPTQISKEQLRMLENIHANLARMLASSFSTEQRAVVDCEIAFVDQTTYAEFIMSLSNPSCSYVFGIEPLGGQAIIDFSLPIAYSFIDRQFGGTGANPPQEARQLTGIERNVMGKVVTRVLANLEATWEQLIKIQVSDAELETNPEFMQAAAPSDTVLLIAFEVNSSHVSGLVNLCYPYFTLEPVMAFMTVQSSTGHGRTRRDSDSEDRLAQLEQMFAPVKVVMGRGEVRLGEVLSLQEGDILKLDTTIKEDAVIYVGERPKFLCSPGLQGKRRAVRLGQPILKADEVNYMTTIEKTNSGTL